MMKKSYKKPSKSMQPSKASKSSIPKPAKRLIPKPKMTGLTKFGGTKKSISPNMAIDPHGRRKTSKRKR